MVLHDIIELPPPPAEKKGGLFGKLAGLAGGPAGMAASAMGAMGGGGGGGGGAPASPKITHYETIVHGDHVTHHDDKPD